MISCEFCAELSNARQSRFGRIYSGKPASRVLARSGSLVAMPTLGQLIPGSLLVLPVKHVETAAALAASQLLRLESFVLDLARVLPREPQFIVFEHGAQCYSGGGCGIYHAHIHVVPVPGQIEVKQLFTNKEGYSPPSLRGASNLYSAWTSLAGFPEYLLARDTFGNTAYAAVSSQESSRFGSQYFRRRLVELCRLNKAWDWRSYTTPEPDFLKTIELFARAKRAVVI